MLIVLLELKLLLEFLLLLLQTLLLLLWNMCADSILLSHITEGRVPSLPDVRAIVVGKPKPGSWEADTDTDTGSGRRRRRAVAGGAPSAAGLALLIDTQVDGVGLLARGAGGLRSVTLKRASVSTCSVLFCFVLTTGITQENASAFGEAPTRSKSGLLVRAAGLTLTLRLRQTLHTTGLLLRLRSISRE